MVRCCCRPERPADVGWMGRIHSGERLLPRRSCRPFPFEAHGTARRRARADELRRDLTAPRPSWRSVGSSSRPDARRSSVRGCDLADCRAVRAHAARVRPRHLRGWSAQPLLFRWLPRRAIRARLPGCRALYAPSLSCRGRAGVAPACARQSGSGSCPFIRRLPGNGDSGDVGHRETKASTGARCAVAGFGQGHDRPAHRR